MYNLLDTPLLSAIIAVYVIAKFIYVGFMTRDKGRDRLNIPGEKESDDRQN